MFASGALLSLIFLTFSVVDATPLSRSTGKNTLNFATKISGTGTLSIIEKDRARAQALKQAASEHPRKRSTSFSVTNTAVYYAAQVGVGIPATNYTLIVDTGSSLTWIGASKPYGNTGQDTGNNVSVVYGSGSFSGAEWIDTVTLAPDLVIGSQSIGVASSVTNISGIDGILGVGPVGLTSGAVSNTGTVPTVSDNLLSQGTISEEVLGVYFVPTSERTSTGTLTFGGVDSSVITSSVYYTSLTMDSPARSYWGIDQSISYHGKTILSKTAGIVDTGTTFILIASDAFQEYQSATGGTLDPTTGMLKISSSEYAALKPLIFTIGGKAFSLSANAQIWPRSLNTAIGGTSDAIYLIIGDIGTASGSGFDFINGYAFLERYYSVYDTTNGRVGFASTAYTSATTN